MSSSSLAADRLRGPARMSDARLVAHQLRYDLLGVWRDPQSRFLTIVLPLIFLVLLTSLFGNHTVHIHGHAIKDSTYYVPGISALGIIATSLVNLVITITGQRESGVLKRRRSTPVPAWALIASRALTSVIVASAIVAVIIAIGRIVYGVQLPSSTLPAFVLGVIVGAAAFCCLSFAAASFIRNEDSAQPLIQADHPAALPHLGRARPQGPAIEHAARHRERVPRQPPRQRSVQGVRPGHDRLGHRRNRPADPRDLGRRRAANRATALQMVSPIHLTEPGTRPKHRPERTEDGKRFQHRALDERISSRGPSPRRSRSHRARLGHRTSPHRTWRR